MLMFMNREHVHSVNSTTPSPPPWQTAEGSQYDALGTHSRLRRDEKVKDQHLTANPSFLRQQLLHPANLAGFKADLDSMGMGGRLRQDVLYHSTGKGSATLVVLLYNSYL